MIIFFRLFAAILLVSGLVAGAIGAGQSRDHLANRAAIAYESARATRLHAQWDSKSTRDILQTITYRSGATDEHLATVRYDLAALAYERGDYESAEHLYSTVVTDSIETEFRRLHNLGNTRYRLGEAEKNPVAAIARWLMALDAYQKALAWKQDKETRENYDFVKAKIEQKQQEARQLAQSGQSKPSRDGLSDQENGDSGNGSDSESGSTASGSQSASGSSAPQDATGTGAQAFGSGETQSGTATQSGAHGPAGTWSNEGSLQGVGSGDAGADGAALTPDERAALEERTRDLDSFGEAHQEYLNRDGTARMQGGFDSMLGNRGGFENAPPTVDKDW